MVLDGEVEDKMIPENSIYKKHRHLFMADVVNPDNIYELYGKGTRVKRWRSYDKGILRCHLLPFPPKKEGEPMSEQEKKANERIRRGEMTYFEWKRKPMFEKCSEEFMIKCAKNPEAEMEEMNKAKAEKDAVERKMRLMIKAKNLPKRSFHLFMNLLKNKNKNKKKKIENKKKKIATINS